MLQWMKQKLTEYTSRKFVAFIITETVMISMVLYGKLTDSWAIIVGVLAPFLTYLFINGTVALNRIKVNANGIQINQEDAIGTDIPHDADAVCDEDDGTIPKQNIPEVGFKK